MKWTVWEVIRLLLVVAVSMVAGLLLLRGFAWVVLGVDDFFRNHSDSSILFAIGLVFCVAVGVFIVWEQLVMLIMMIKGYSAQQMLFGDASHSMLSVEEKWEKRKLRWRRFFGRK
jgi:hypothetical protein